MNRRLLAALLLFVGASAATAQETLSSRQWDEVIGFVDETLSTSRSGSDNARTIGPGLGVSVVPQKAVSRSTGEICGEGCFDPCRAFEVSVAHGGGRTIYRYLGRRCSNSADFSAWGPDGAITLDRVLRSGPDPELLRRAARDLAALSYLPEGAGTPDEAETLAALREFRADAAFRGAVDEDISTDDIDALRAAVDRSGTGGRCAVPPTSRFTACGALAF